MSADILDNVEHVDEPSPGNEVPSSKEENVQSSEQATDEVTEETPEEIPEKKDRLPEVAQFIRAESKQVRLTDTAVFLEEPFGFTEEELVEIWAEMEEKDDYRDIRHARDERTNEEFVHSDNFLTAQYARMMLRTRGDDPVYLIVSTVRDESRIYPRPTAAAFFEFEPFSLALEDVLKHVETIKADPAYADIKCVTPSNGAVYMYSDRFLDEPKAQNMAQWVEVDMNLDRNQ